MKILLLNNLYEPYTLGGGGRSLRKIAQGLSQKDHTPVVVTLHPESEIKEDVIDGIRVFYLPLKNIDWPFSERGHRRFLRPIFNLVDLYNPFMGRQVERILKQVQPDIVYTKNLYGFSTRVWANVSNRDIPLVHTLGDYYLICLHATLTRDGSVCESQCFDCQTWTANQKRMSNKVDGVIGVSEFVLKKHHDFGFFRRTSTSKVIPPPVEWNDDTFDKNKRPNDDLPLRVGYIGRLTPEKGIEDLFKATEPFSADELTIHVAGEGTETFVDTLSPRFEKDTVSYYGHVEPDDFFKKIDVLVVPSRMPETFGRVVLESFGYARPVIGTRIGALPELISEGINGYLYEPRDVDQLRSIIEKMVENPEICLRMGKKAKHNASNFGTERTLEDHVDFFQTILTQPSKS